MENNNPLCSVCNIPGGYMGQLGERHWFRCQGCGLEFSIIHTVDDFLSLDQGYAQIEETDLKIDREKIPYRDVPTLPDCVDPYCNGAGKPYQYHGQIWYCCSVCHKEYTRDQIVSVLQKWKYPKTIKYLDFHVKNPCSSFEEMNIPHTSERRIVNLILK